MQPPPDLGVDTWNEAFALFHSALGQGRDTRRFRNSLKNARDAFDAHLPSSGRIGWRRSDDARSPQTLTALAQETLVRWRDRSDTELLEAVERVRDGLGSGSDQQDGHDRSIPDRAVPPPAAAAAREAAIEDERDGHDPERARRRSAEAKLIGDLGEQVVIDYLREDPDIVPGSIDHLAARGETPGWDISCRRTNGEPLYIEVKATVLDRMVQFELTENERAAAERFGA